MQTQETPVTENKDATTETPTHRSLLYTLKNVTPARLGFLLFFCCVLSSLFCIAAVYTVQQHDEAAKTVGIDSAPSVISAYEIKSGLLAMDRDLANQLLYKADQAEGEDMENDFEKWRGIVCKQLVAGAKNITYSGELQPIENIQVGLGTYTMEAQRARDLHSEGKDKDALLAYRLALRTMNAELLPNIDALEKANRDKLEDTYNHEKSASNLSRGFLLVMGLILVFSLLVTQFFLLRKFHRRICPPILLSMICLMVLLHHLTNSLSANSNFMKVAKEDSYDSILALLTTRADAFEACACASRRLLDPENSDEYEREYSASLGKIVQFEGQHNIDETVELARKQLQKGEKLNLPGFGGSLAVELNNACFEGEGEPSLALDTLAAFAEYCQAEWKVKELDEAGQHEEAVRMCLSYNPSGSKYPFTQFDDALVRTLKINSDQMASGIKGAFKSLSNLAIATELVCLLIVICVYSGLTPRMDEYVKCGTPK